jgi:hypothetical protein
MEQERNKGGIGARIGLIFPEDSDPRISGIFYGIKRGGVSEHFVHTPAAVSLKIEGNI